MIYRRLDAKTPLLPRSTVWDQGKSPDMLSLHDLAVPLSRNQDEGLGHPCPGARLHSPQRLCLVPIEGQSLLSTSNNVGIVPDWQVILQT